MVSLGVAVPACQGGLAGYLAATAVSFLATVPFCARLGLGAGCVKAQTAFAGCGLAGREAVIVAVIGAAMALLLTAFGVIGALLAIFVRDRNVPLPAQITFSIGALSALGYHFAFILR